MAHEPIQKKSLGQHWLHDLGALNAMVYSAEVNSNDTILEIGPGLGTLTELLCKQAKQVVAVELDQYLADKLPKRVPATNLEVLREDILHFDFTQLPPNYKVVANIPYYLTSNLLRTLSDTPNPPISATLLMQKEVAQRVAATPGDMSLLSVAVQLYWQVRLEDIIPARLFTPPPKVDSQILVLHRIDSTLFPDVDTKAFFRIVRIGFAQKRKTLLNNLSSGLHLDRADVTAICRSLDIDPQRRAQSLSLSEWHTLFLELNS